jgi:hypothetical protein
MTCYENLRRPKDPDKEKTFKKLENYFRAIDDDKVEEYHKMRGRE